VVFYIRDEAAEAVRLIRSGAYNCLGSATPSKHCANPSNTPSKRNAPGKGARRPWPPLSPGRPSWCEAPPCRPSPIPSASLASALHRAHHRRIRTGKKSARPIHMPAPANQPWGHQKLFALPENLLEAKFGHVKALLPAINAASPFETANKGTLFLMKCDSPSTAAKIAARSADREFQRLAVRNIKVESANPLPTSTCWSACARQVPRRLYYRLNVVPLQMPLCAPRSNSPAGLSLVRKLPDETSRSRLAPNPRPAHRSVRDAPSGKRRQNAIAMSHRTCLSGRFRTSETPASKCPIIQVSAVRFPPVDSNRLTQFQTPMLERALTKTDGNKTAPRTLGMKRPSSS